MSRSDEPSPSAVNHGAADERELKSASYEFFVMLLSLLSLANIIIIVIRPPASSAREVAIAGEALLSIFFLGDFLYRFLTAASRRRYFLRSWGWADLLATVPFPGLRLFRVFRVVRVVRLIRREGRAEIIGQLVDNRAGSTLYLTVIMTLVLLETMGSAVLAAERSAAEGNIANASDALWWGYVTITTVGYGDRYPTTMFGRVVGVLLLTSGVALFSVLTGYIANAFLEPRRRHRREYDVSDPRAQVEAIRDLIGSQEQALAEIGERVDKLERSISGMDS
ncbi:MAG: potassium channel family protein [Coriobacteriia bacterium]|nr:potassium channel family protein [Coriobacteriia bacterium]